MSDITVVGLGKLGLCTATCFANLGFDVIGYDKNPDCFRDIGAGNCYIDEPNLQSNMEEAVRSGRLKAWNSLYEAVIHSTRTYIIVPTPSGLDGKFSNKCIMDVLNTMLPAIRDTDHFHVINIVSTVMPGSCYEFIEYMENGTGKKCGVNFGLTYNPEFIAIGTVMRDFLNPDMVLIGHSDERSLEVIRRDYINMHSQIKPMSLISAEMTKLSLNYFLALKISYANELASICEKVPGTDIDAITDAIGSDSRIGEKLLRAGLGFGGPCLGRDNVAFGEFGKSVGYFSSLSPATLAINQNVINRIVSRIQSHTPNLFCVDVFGMSYKPGTKLTEGSQSILLKEELERAGYKVRTFDKPISYEDKKLPKAIVMMSQDMKMPLHTIASKEILLVDPWRRYGAISDKFTYYGMGKI